MRMEWLETTSRTKTGMRLQIAWAIVVVAWFVLPLVAGPFCGMVQGHWTVQDTPKLYLVIAVIGLSWFLFGVALVLIVGGPWNLQLVGGLLACALIAAGTIGSIAFNLINCVGDKGLGQLMEFEQVPASLKGSARLRAVADPIVGTTFAVGVTRVPHIARRPTDAFHIRYQGLIRRGRLDVWWVAFLNRDETIKSVSPTP